MQQLRKVAIEPVEIDVGELPAPEPFHRVMAAISTLEDQQYLLVHHRKQPMLLYRPLIDMGYDFYVRHGQTRAFEIVIWRNTQDCPITQTEPNLAPLNDQSVPIRD